MTTTFIGVDLAWQGNRNHTGVAVAPSERLVLEQLHSPLVFVSTHEHEELERIARAV